MFGRWLLVKICEYFEIQDLIFNAIYCLSFSSYKIFNCISIIIYCLSYIFVRKMLTNTFKILVNNLFKKILMGKKKIISVFGTCGLKIKNICIKKCVKSRIMLFKT